MRGTWAVIAAALATWSIAGCNTIAPTSSASPEPPVAATASVRAGVDICSQLTRVFGERRALGDAFRVAIGGDFDGAIAQAHATQGRLDAIVEELPSAAGLPEPQARLRDLAESSAGLVGAATRILDDPERKVVDRDLILVEGRAVLQGMDVVFVLRQPGDTIDTACPGLAFSADPVSFPPPPTNAALGLPDMVGPLTLEPHIGRVDASMAQVFESIGVDPKTVRGINVQLSDGSVVDLIQVFDRVDAPAPTIAAAVRDLILPEANRPFSQEIAGFRVITYRDPNDDTRSVHVAVRRDRVALFHGIRDAVVRDILEAIP